MGTAEGRRTDASTASRQEWASICETEHRGCDWNNCAAMPYVPEGASSDSHHRTFGVNTKHPDPLSYNREGPG